MAWKDLRANLLGQVGQPRKIDANSMEAMLKLIDQEFNTLALEGMKTKAEALAEGVLLDKRLLPITGVFDLQSWKDGNLDEGAVKGHLEQFVKDNPHFGKPQQGAGGGTVPVGNNSPGNMQGAGNRHIPDEQVNKIFQETPTGESYDLMQGLAAFVPPGGNGPIQ